jgi:hypothetical protein
MITKKEHKLASAEQITTPGEFDFYSEPNQDYIGGQKLVRVNHNYKKEGTK